MVLLKLQSKAGVIVEIRIISVKKIAIISPVLHKENASTVRSKGIDALR